MTVLPDIANPELPTAIIRAPTFSIRVLVYDRTSKKNASVPKPPQFITFRTFVGDNIFLDLNLSASIPPHGTTIAITKCGIDPIIPASDGPNPSISSKNLISDF